uniref:DUF4083 domain-containing protein n=1 Tax=Sphingobacterium sp. (strain 21) TaxID=743722 RepID=F4C9U4_SPHS2
MFYSILFILVYAATIIFAIYILYCIIDRWVNRSINVRREQNELLAKLIDVLERDNRN